MSDNPFAEPDDSDRTVIRPAPGGRKPAPRPESDPDATHIGGVARTRDAFREEAGAAPRAAPADKPDTAAVFGSSPLLAAAAPLLQLLARLRNTVTPPDPGDLREHAAREMRAFEQRARAAGVQPDYLRPAHYALCASLDDVVLNTPWGSTGSWAAHSLVSTFHQEVRSGERFFDILGLMRQEPARFLPVLELMYLCLSLGFMGRYRLSPRGPAEIDRLREEVYALIAGQRGRADAELSPAWRGVPAPYRPMRPHVPVWVAGTVALAALGGLFAWLSTSVNASSDALYERMVHVPPIAMPVIARAAPVQPPAPAPAPAEPGALERLRAFLAPEIKARLVEVLGSEDMPLVRVRQSGMFGSGSAAVTQQAMPLLMGIGAALKEEQGPVQMIGYTDNQPIRTVRFPSNFQLSVARAAAARDIVARTIGNASRLSAEGRADADPIASNATPAGRAANRRIEIILHRQG